MIAARGFTKNQPPEEQRERLRVILDDQESRALLYVCQHHAPQFVARAEEEGVLPSLLSHEKQEVRQAVMLAVQHQEEPLRDDSRPEVHQGEEARRTNTTGRQSQHELVEGRRRTRS